MCINSTVVSKIKQFFVHNTLVSILLALIVIGTVARVVVYWNTPFGFSRSSRSATFLSFDSSGITYNLFVSVGDSVRPVTEHGTIREEAGVIHEAIQLDGSGYLSIPSTEDLNITEPLTIAMWVKPQGHDWQALVSKGDGSGVYAYHFAIAPNHTLGYYSTHGGWKTSSLAMIDAVPTWHHVAMTLGECDAVGQNCTLKFYLDGKLDTNAIYRDVTSGTQNTDPLFIGAWSAAHEESASFPQWNFVGSMDELSIAPREESDTDIANLFAEGAKNGTVTSTPSVQEVGVYAPSTPLDTAPSNGNAGANAILMPQTILGQRFTNEALQKLVSDYFVANRSKETRDGVDVFLPEMHLKKITIPQRVVKAYGPMSASLMGQIGSKDFFQNDVTLHFHPVLATPTFDVKYLLQDDPSYHIHLRYVSDPSDLFSFASSTCLTGSYRRGVREAASFLWSFVPTSTVATITDPCKFVQESPYIAADQYAENTVRAYQIDWSMFLKEYPAEAVNNFFVQPPVILLRRDPEPTVTSTAGGWGYGGDEYVVIESGVVGYAPRPYDGLPLSEGERGAQIRKDILFANQVNHEMISSLRIMPSCDYGCAY